MNAWNEVCTPKTPPCHLEKQVNPPLQEGETALQYASSKGYDDIVKILLDKFYTDVNFSNDVSAKNSAERFMTSQQSV